MRYIVQSQSFTINQVILTSVLLKMLNPLSLLSKPGLILFWSMHPDCTILQQPLTSAIKCTWGGGGGRGVGSAQ